MAIRPRAPHAGGAPMAAADPRYATANKPTKTPPPSAYSTNGLPATIPSPAWPKNTTSPDKPCTPV